MPQRQVGIESLKGLLVWTRPLPDQANCREEPGIWERVAMIRFHGPDGVASRCIVAKATNPMQVP
jgi:hypothetical protein